MAVIAILFCLQCISETRRWLLTIVFSLQRIAKTSVDIFGTVLIDHVIVANVDIHVAECLGSLGQTITRCRVIAIPVARTMTAAGEPEVMTLTEIVLTILFGRRSQKLCVFRLKLCTIFGHRLQ